MDLAKILEQIGLTEKEAKIYLALLELREALPSVLARKASVKRPTTYVILEQLLKKGLVGHVKRGRLLYFSALDPRQLLETERDRYEKLQHALPELLQLHEKLAATPKMSVFEGKEGLIKIMEDTLTAKTEILCWADVAKAVECLREYYPTYIKKKVARNLWLRGVFCYDKIALRFKKFGKQELREIYLVPKEKFPFKNEINIYDDKVAIISQDDEIGVIIQNQAIADTQRAIFELGFEYAKILEKDLLTDEDMKYVSS